MYKAIYRQYRPEILEEVIGQDHIIKVLKSQIENDRVAHAYLFCGTRGTGKTTTARLLAKGVNCLSDGARPCGECENCKAIQNGNFLDLIEIDAASNNGVDDIRQLRENINFPPISSEKKVYIIDEAHMLSKGARNAFLKTLEEPPSHVIFILATTEPHTLPATILSRCIRMDFRRVDENILVEQMKKICKRQEVEIADNDLKLIAANADGSVRDCLTLFEQCVTARGPKVSRDEILDALGIVDDDIYLDIVDATVSGNVSGIFSILQEAFYHGKEARQILTGIINHYRNMMIAKNVEDVTAFLNMSDENIGRLISQSKQVSVTQISDVVMKLSEVNGYMIHTGNPRILLETVLMDIVSTVYGKTKEVDVTVNLEGEKFDYDRDDNDNFNSDKKKAVNRNIATEIISESTIGNGGEIESGTVKDNSFIHKIEDVTILEESEVGSFKEEIGLKEKDDISSVEIAIDDESSLYNNGWTERDLEKIWMSVCDKLIEHAPEFATARRGAFVSKIENEKVEIVVLNDVIKSILDKHIKSIFKIMSDIIKAEMTINIVSKTDKKNETMDIDKLSDKIEEVIGIRPNIVD